MNDALQMTGINMVVGIKGQPGKPMLRETRGLQLKVQRPLRDLFKKVPELAIDVQVRSLLTSFYSWRFSLWSTV
jgi:hypothetical protein